MAPRRRPTPPRSPATLLDAGAVAAGDPWSGYLERFEPAYRAELDAFQERGGALAFIHYAVDGYKAPDAFARRIGLAWQNGRSRFRHGPVDLTITDPKHPITRGLEKLHLEDETYWDLAGDPKAITVLATAVEDRKEWPILWTKEAGKGRVFGCIPGHYTWTFDDPLFRLVLLRGMAWAVGEPADRWADLALEGASTARVAP